MLEHESRLVVGSLAFVLFFHLSSCIGSRTVVVLLGLAFCVALRSSLASFRMSAVTIFCSRLLFH